MTTTDADAEAGPHGDRARKYTKITITCTADYQRWVERAAKASRLPIPTYLDHLIARDAEGRGIEGPPDRMGKEVGG